MTAQKYKALICTAIIFIICVAAYIKITDKAKKLLFPSILSSGILGVVSLGAVLLAELVCGNIIKFNLCTFAISFFLSLPGVAAMLFLNVI